MRVLLILGHPRGDSFGAALFDAFGNGMTEAGVDHRKVQLRDLQFDLHVRCPSPADQELEPDLVRMQSLINWADHLVFVYPTWWGTAPALLKGFLDRVLTPGFAFRFHDDGTWDKLLVGKTAELLTTMDTPRAVYRWIYAAPGHRALARATLGFCGVRTVRTQSFGIVERSTLEQRRQWLAAARERGAELASGPLSRSQRLGGRAAAWLRALRLQFYPMTWVAYAVGALLATPTGSLNRSAFWIGYGCLFALEAATVFSNEYFDYDSDRRNQNPGPFNGGSRVLVDGALGFKALRGGIAFALATFVLLYFWLLGRAPVEMGSVSIVLWVLAVLALGYTVPPLKLSHRGGGEVDVALTHSLGVLLFGFVMQGGAIFAWQPWLVSLPLLLAVVPSITLSGIPDRAADRAAGKRTMVVRIGPRRSLQVAIATTFGAAAAALLVDTIGFEHRLYGMAAWLAAAHGALLCVLLLRRLPEPESRRHFNGLMAAALSYILWFGLAPLWMLS